MLPVLVLANVERMEQSELLGVDTVEWSAEPELVELLAGSHTSGLLDSCCDDVVREDRPQGIVGKLDPVEAESTKTQQRIAESDHLLVIVAVAGLEGLDSAAEGNMMRLHAEPVP
jgi:hypothetical protein